MEARIVYCVTAGDAASRDSHVPAAGELTAPSAHATLHRFRIHARPATPFPTNHEWRIMPTVIGYHDVKDQKHWLASPKRAEFFGKIGVTGIRTFIDPENPHRVAVMMDVPDMNALQAAMQTPAAAEAMAHDGVVAETVVILVEA